MSVRACDEAAAQARNPPESVAMRMLTAVALLAAVSCAGCGSASAPPPTAAVTVPATGQVMYRGKPLARGSITLEPTDGGREARGTIGPDGTFVLSTYAEGDGALIGVHSVSISGIDPPLRTRKEPHVRIDRGKTNYVIDLR